MALVRPKMNRDRLEGTFVWMLDELLRYGRDVPSRAGNTKEMTFVHFTVADPIGRYLDVPHRHVSVPAQIAETMWVLAGRSDVDWLAHYLPQAPKFSDDGEVWRAGYGPRLRNWQAAMSSDGNGTDQLENIIKLLKGDPTTRRAVISLWDPASDVMDSKDIPCNNWLHFLARDGELHLHVATRSNDAMWGWSGINNFEWSVLLEIVAYYAGLKVGDIHYAISSLHLYERHYEKAAKIVKAAQEDKFSPGRQRVRFAAGSTQLGDHIFNWFQVENSIRGGTFNWAQVQRLIEQTMTEPMMRQWLYVMAHYWGYEQALGALDDTEILMATVQSPKRKTPMEVISEPLSRNGLELTDYLVALHTEKSAAYGDSWKKHGELFSIVPNVARKVDRILAGGETTDETQLDTAMDLVIYLCKYQNWLTAPTGSEVLAEENFSISYWVKGFYGTWKRQVMETEFNRVMEAAQAGSTFRHKHVELLLEEAVGHLVALWNGPTGRTLRNTKRSWNPDA